MAYERKILRETPDGIVPQKNHINLHRGIFTLESRGTLRDLVNRFDIQDNDQSQEAPESAIAESQLEDDGTL